MPTVPAPGAPLRSLLHLAGWLAVWGLLTAVALSTRSLVPIDETRYAAVAWEMWARGDGLVLHLNGEPYSHKPPLLFWLIELSWAVFGIGDAQARLVTALAAFANLPLLAVLAARLWPQDPGPRRCAPWLLYGCLYYALFGTMLMFDLLMSVCVLIGLTGLAGAWRSGGRRRDWLLYALGLGLGGLTKGPAVLVYLLPPALLAPLWIVEARPDWRRWYRALGLSLLGGFALALAWAVPAAIAGGAEYRGAILWGQTAGRMVQAFAHQRPFWWYLPVLPLILLPWTLWLPLWRALPALRTEAGGSALRFCLACFVPGFLIFSAVSGKQVHYLLPLLPALLLPAARALTLGACDRRPGRLAVALVIAPVVGLGVLLALAPSFVDHYRWPDWVGTVSPLWGVAVAALGLAWAPLLRSRLAGLWLAALPAVLGALLYAGIGRPATAALDGSTVARAIGTLQQAGVTVAHPGKYHGEFQFPGRLAQPLTVIGRGSALDWARAHPDAALVVRHDELEPEHAALAVAVQPYRERFAALWRAQTLIEHPELLARESGETRGGEGDE